MKNFSKMQFLIVYFVNTPWEIVYLLWMLMKHASHFLIPKRHNKQTVLTNGCSIVLLIDGFWLYSIICCTLSQYIFTIFIDNSICYLFFAILTILIVAVLSVEHLIVHFTFLLVFNWTSLFFLFGERFHIIHSLKQAQTLSKNWLLLILWCNWWHGFE